MESMQSVINYRAKNDEKTEWTHTKNSRNFEKEMWRIHIECILFLQFALNIHRTAFRSGLFFFAVVMNIQKLRLSKQRTKGCLEFSERMWCKKKRGNNFSTAKAKFHWMACSFNSRQNAIRCTSQTSNWIFMESHIFRCIITSKIDSFAWGKCSLQIVGCIWIEQLADLAANNKCYVDLIYHWILFLTLTSLDIYPHDAMTGHSSKIKLKVKSWILEYNSIFLEKKT